MHPRRTGDDRLHPLFRRKILITTPSDFEFEGGRFGPALGQRISDGLKSRLKPTFASSKGTVVVYDTTCLVNPKDASCSNPGGGRGIARKIDAESRLFLLIEFVLCILAVLIAFLFPDFGGKWFAGIERSPTAWPSAAAGLCSAWE